MRILTSGLASLAASAAALVVTACSSGGHIDVSMTSTALTTPVSIVAPAHLFVDVTELRVHVASDDADDQASPGMPDNDEAAGAEDSSGWVTLFSGSHPIDLYDTVATTELLGGADVPAGRITQIRLVLAADPTLTIGDQSYPVACPSCTQTGVKVVPHGTLTVPDGGTLALTLVFDASASIGADDGGGWRLSPVIRL